MMSVAELFPSLPQPVDLLAALAALLPEGIDSRWGRSDEGAVGLSSRNTTRTSGP
jgi:hypothetical protein